MFGPLLVLQIALATQPPAIYSSPALEAFIGAAATANHAPPQSLRGYRGRIESELSLLVRDTLGREHVAQVEQLALRARWTRSGEYDLRVIGYRSQTVGVPYSALSFARSWTVPSLYGDRLTLGVDIGQASAGPRSTDTLRAVHPLAADRERFYRYTGGDTIAVLRSRDRSIPIVRVRAQPIFDSVSGGSRIGAFDGEIDFDATRHQIVRMRGQFVASSPPRSRRISLARVPGLVAVAYVEFVNAEVDSRYWLPAFQRSEFQATFAPLGAQRSVFRLVSRFAELDLDQAVQATDSAEVDNSSHPAEIGAVSPRLRRRLSFAPADSVSGYREWMQSLGTATATVSSADFDDLAPDAWRTTGAPRFDITPTRLEEVFRFNRVEGAYTGFAANERFRDAFPGLTAHAYGGWSWTENTPRGGVSATYHSGSLTSSARVERILASTNDFTPPLENGGEGFGALIGGIDDQDYVDRRVAALSLTRSIGGTRGALVVVDGGVGEDRPEVARLVRSPFGVGRFRLNRASGPGQYVRASTTIEVHPDVTGIYLEPGIGLVASYETAGGELRWQRAELTIAARRNFSDFVISGRAQSGIVSGRTIPPQQLFELGGENALPGYEYKAFAGDRASAAGVLAGYTFPVLRRPWRVVRSLVVPGLSPGFALGVQAGWAEASNQAAHAAITGLDPAMAIDCVPLTNCPIPLSTPTNGIRATVDARLTLFGGLVGAGVARPVDRAAPWRFAVRFGQEF